MREQTIVVVEDDPALREALADTLETSGYRVAACADGGAALSHLRAGNAELVLSDIRMQPMDGRALLRQIKHEWPELPVVLMTAYGTVQDAVSAMQEGAGDYLVKPFSADDLQEKLIRYLPKPSLLPSQGPVVADPKSRELLSLAKRVAASEATVLIGGPSGTGKEVIARYVHQQSSRADGPFVAVNCAAIPDNMLEAMLFGYEKGAFTGAYKTTPGKFEQAKGGTLLLDEVSEMPLALQAKLLRILQERQVERLAGNTLIDLDVRVLATTNRKLREEVAAGRFREDLFYRLNVFPIYLPPLKTRPADVTALAQHLLQRHTPAGRTVPALNASATEKLQTHDWPGNVRELENVIQRALILCAGDTVDADAILFAAEAEYSEPAAPESDGQLGDDLRLRESEVICDALAAANGSRKLAAERLGISPRTLRYKLARMRDTGMAVPD
jgi:two-component system response regulator FlrC